tara:strand:- start:476 stop:883 length:408 start_codon:yes stop_codon:yes gene_type:complete
MDTIVVILLTINYSLIIGIIFAQALLTAPVVFKVLDNETASIFLGRIFPRYYLIIFLFCLLAVLISYLFLERSFLIMASINGCLAVIGYIIIPLAKTANNRSWDRLFTFLNRLSVYITISIFIFSITELVRISLA